MKQSIFAIYNFSYACKTLYMQWNICLTIYNVVCECVLWYRWIRAGLTSHCSIVIGYNSDISVCSDVSWLKVIFHKHNYEVLKSMLLHIVVVFSLVKPCWDLFKPVKVHLRCGNRYRDLNVTRLFWSKCLRFCFSHIFTPLRADRGNKTDPLENWAHLSNICVNVFMWLLSSLKKHTHNTYCRYMW